MEEFTSQTGKEVRIAPASFKEAMKLKSLVEKSLAENGINLTKIQDKELTEFLKGDLLKSLLAVDSSIELHDQVIKCLEKSLYDNEKITVTTFDDLDARADYYEILVICLKVNLLPFFRTLLSLLPTTTK